MADHYNLYLDESKCAPMFCVAGIILKDTELPKVDTEIKRIKSIIWHDILDSSNIILHEKDIKAVVKNGFQEADVGSEYERFMQNSVGETLYRELEYSLTRIDGHIIGACVDENKLKEYYGSNSMNNLYLTAMQSIIENFAQFLIKNNATGTIILESRDTDGETSPKSADRQVRRHFMNIMSIGSMFLTSAALQDVIQGIKFVPKSANNSAVQLADFIPNQIARKATHKRPVIYGIYPVINSMRYDGTLQEPGRFGVKIIPCEIPEPIPSSSNDRHRRRRNRRRGSRGSGRRNTVNDSSI